VISGPNVGAAPSQPPIEIPWDATTNSWFLNYELIVDPLAGQMGKHFLSRPGPTGVPLIIDALQPFPQIVWENFIISPSARALRTPVTDWHEEIHTPGWQWVTPAQRPDLFPTGQTLITRNGLPWPSQPIPMDPADPTKLWVEFPPIQPGRILDIHKALLWVGTEGNRFWGDNMNDAGLPVEERFIDVWEHPTIPEPATAVLLCLGALAFLFQRRRCRR
jgi:hypothetical protein